MRVSPSLAPVYRKPREMEQCWECTVSHRLYVYEPIRGVGAGAAKLDSSFVPRCPCHQRVMRRCTAPWQGCPGWVARAVFASIIVYIIWAVLAALCIVPGLGPWTGAC